MAINMREPVATDTAAAMATDPSVRTLLFGAELAQEDEALLWCSRSEDPLEEHECLGSDK